MSSLVSLFRRKKGSVVANLIKPSPILKLNEGEVVILTYTQATDKLKVLATYIAEGIKNGDRIFYVYPHEDNEKVRSALSMYGFNVDTCENNGTLYLGSLTQHFMTDGVFNKEKAIRLKIDFWIEAKKRGYKHVRNIEDVGDFSFLEGKWQTYLDYWDDPIWYDPQWTPPTNKYLYIPFIMDITTINVGSMEKENLTALLKTFRRIAPYPVKFFDFLEDANLFSNLMGLDHRRLAGQKILLEFDPASNYETIVESFVKEALANVEPVFIFAHNKSILHESLSRYRAIKFFLTSSLTSSPKLTSENEVLLPLSYPALILDYLNQILETQVDMPFCFAFDIISELLQSQGLDKTHIFLCQILEMLYSKKTSALFLFNSGAHESQVLSNIRRLFNNQLTFGKDGLKITKISQES